MKIGGREAKPKGEAPPLVFERNPIEESIVFRIKRVQNYNEFNALVPEPVAPKMITPQGVVPDVEEPGYVQQSQARDLKRGAWVILKSLEPSNIEWETVNLNDPSTWQNYISDLQAVLDEQELLVLLNKVWAANTLDDASLEEAAANFFRSQLPSA